MLCTKYVRTTLRRTQNKSHTRKPSHYLKQTNADGEVKRYSIEHDQIIHIHNNSITTYNLTKAKQTYLQSLTQKAIRFVLPTGLNFILWVIDRLSSCCKVGLCKVL